MSHMLYLSDFKSLFSNNFAIVKAYIASMECSLRRIIASVTFNTLSNFRQIELITL